MGEFIHKILNGTKKSIQEGLLISFFFYNLFNLKIISIFIFYFILFIYLFFYYFYLFIYGCVVSSFLCEGFL